MKDRKINTNRPHLLSEEITSKRNFEEILHNNISTSHRSYRKIVISRIGIVILLISSAYLIYSTLHKPISSTTSTPHQVTPPAPYLTTLSLPYDSVSLNITDGGIIKTQRGLELDVPSNALEKKDGEVVNGKVSFKITEFKDPIAYYASQVNFQPDTTNNTVVIPDKMFKIEAFQNQKPLFIRNGYEISVNYQTRTLSDKHNVYYWDSIHHKLILQSEDSIVIATALIEEAEDGSEQLSSLLHEYQQLSEDIKVSPMVPQKTENTLYTTNQFNVAYPTIDLPENMTIDFNNDTLHHFLKLFGKNENELFNINWSKVESSKKGLTFTYPTYDISLRDTSTSFYHLLEKHTQFSGIDTSVDLTKGFQIILVGSFTCKHCLNTYNDLLEIENKTEPLPIKIISYGQEPDASYFFRQANQHKKPYKTNKNLDEIISLAGGDSFPIVYVVRNGGIIHKFDFSTFDILTSQENLKALHQSIQDELKKPLEGKITIPYKLTPTNSIKNKKDRKKAIAKRFDTQSHQNSDTQVTKAIKRVFKISKFGTYINGSTQQLKNNISLKGNFTDRNGKVVKATQFYIINQTNQSLLKFDLSNHKEKITFNRYSKNIGFGFVDSTTIFLLDSTGFSDLAQSKNVQVSFEKNIRNIPQLRKVLKQLK